MAGAARAGELRRVPARAGRRAARTSQTVRGVRGVRPVGVVDPRLFGRARAVGPAPDSVTDPPGSGRGPGRLADHSARSQVAPEADVRRPRWARGPGPGGVLPTAIAAHQQVPAERRRVRDRHGRPGLEDHLQPDRPMSRNAVPARTHRRRVRVQQHQVRHTDLPELHPGHRT